MQQMLLGVGASTKATYIDDIFSTYLYEETGSTVTVNNGVDMSEGGMVWFKNREATDSHVLVDTVRGGTKVLHSNTTAAESTQSGAITSFNNNGFAIGNYGNINGGSNKDVVSWTFRKSPMFDVVTYTGNGSARTIAHSLASVPGLIIVKGLTNTSGWEVYHRSTGATKTTRLDTNGATSTSSTRWNDTEPTSTHFTVSTSSNVNESGSNYIAYLFAGGESTASEAVSVDFDGSGDYLSLAASSDFAFGTGDFTVECWVKPNTITQSGVFQISADTGGLSTGGIAAALGGDSRWKLGYGNLTQLSGGSAAKGQWHHLAYVRHSGVSKLYINGIEEISVNDTTNYTYQNLAIGGYYSSSYLIDAEISNFRVVKGTAVYTSSFRPTYEPLTNITNTKLLCCNNSSTTGKTTGGTITANGDPTASTDSPFDDPAGFVFGESGSENVIKCGSFTTDSNGAATINLGWEPQWVLHKASSASGGWSLIDNMRGWPTEGINTTWLNANTNDAENNSNSNTSITSTGFKVHLSSYWQNMTRIFVAIRRPDGYCGKPVELGTDVFAMDTGASQLPVFDSGFPVDFALLKKTTASESWWPGARLISGKYLQTNNTAYEGNNADWVFDFNDGWNTDNSGSFNNSNHQSWMWKRHAGFDVVTFEGTNSAGLQIPHNLSKVPEMMWLKNRDASENWAVYHKGLNGGTNPGQYATRLNSSAAELDSDGFWNDTAPTATAFTVGNNGETNGFEQSMIAILFASVDGISKVGSYTGTGSSGNAVTTGFQPRFILMKSATSTKSWAMFDTVRGLGDAGLGHDPRLFLDTDAAQTTGFNFLTVSSTGFAFETQQSSHLNSNGETYIYYAHA